MHKLLLTCTALVAFSVPAFALPLELHLEALPFHFDPGQQANITGCIIAGTTCGQQHANFAYTNFTQGGAIHTYAEVSPIYTAAQLIAETGGVAFNVGIDVNINHSASETLNLFQVIADGTVIYQFNGIADSNNIGVASSPGNGWSDYRLFSVNLVDPALAALHLSLASQIQFHSVWKNANAGAESFFVFEGSGGTVINPVVAAVPEPSTWAMMILGFLGVAGYGARNKYRKEVLA